MPTPEPAAIATPAATPAATREPVAAPLPGLSKHAVTHHPPVRKAQTASLMPKTVSASETLAQPSVGENSAAAQVEVQAVSTALPETPVPSAAQADPAGTPGRPSSANSIGRLFMGIGLLILFGGILYALRQFQEKRTVRRNLNAVSLSAEGKKEAGRSVSAVGTPGAKPQDAGSGALPRLRAPQPEPQAMPELKREAAAQPVESAQAPVRKKRAPSVSKTAKTGTRKSSQKAALRIARPAVKTVRLAAAGSAKKTAGRTRRKKA